MFLICSRPDVFSISLTPSWFAMICAAPSLEINPDSCFSFSSIFEFISVSDSLVESLIFSMI
tara:strand:- start:3098 stop:3283 length:186 start_codon:yes stop_codon:yes gene_type:complete